VGEEREGKSRVRVRRFNLDLLSEANRDFAPTGLREAMRRSGLQFVTIDESDDQAMRKAEEEHLMVPRMPAGRARRFSAPICLSLPARESREPTRVIAAAIQALLLNPKTGLLGSWALEAHINQEIFEQKPFGFLYLDIDNFKAYNDVYNVKRGDGAIIMLAQLIEEILRAADKTGEDLPFHIGGDDFAIVTTPGRMDAIGTALVDNFRGRALALYDPKDQQRGYIEIENRQRQKQQFPLMTLTVAGVSSEVGPLCSYQQVCDIAAELKNHAKNKEPAPPVSSKGNTYLRERRRRQEKPKRQGQPPAQPTP